MRAGAAGATAGVLILGIGGRLLMRLTALIAGRAPGFSWGGSLEVLAAGALFGGAGGLAWLALARFGPRRFTGLALGTTAFAAIELLSDAARGAAGGLAPGPRAFALALFLALCIGWGLATDALARRGASP